MHVVPDMAAHTGGWLAMTTLGLALLVAGAAIADRPYAKFEPVPFTKVRLTDDFWAPRIETNTSVSLPHQIRMCEETGRLRNFERGAGKLDGEFEGLFFNDSDVYKVLEGACYCYQIETDEARRAGIKADMDRLVDLIVAAQGEDGYLNNFITLMEPDKRWADLPNKHELYCAGNLIEAGVAHYNATGERKLLDAAIRFADLIDGTFGPDKRYGVPGHEEIALALVKLADLTGEERYRRLAQYFVDARGKSGAEYCQDHKPVREQDVVVGHAVRAMYLYCGVCDLVATSGDTALLDASRRVWHDLVDRKMYVTAGVGPSAHNEGFTTPYDLPNDSAYAETCAAIGLAFWAKRMLEVEGDSQYADVLERVLYNGFLSGVSLSGDHYFYVNPLASRGRHHRTPWFTCACCPPNVLRLLPTVGGYLYSVKRDTVWTHLYAGSEAEVETSAGVVRIVQATNYPWDGNIAITLTPADGTPVELELALRVPGWCRGFACSVNGEKLDAAPGEDGYLRIRRLWNDDTVTLALEMPARRVEAAPPVEADRGRVALMRGPLVYCLEEADNRGGVRDIYLPREEPIAAEFRPDLLGGVTVLTATARRVQDPGWSGELYRDAPPVVPAPIVAIPYCDWDNREPGEMVVWLPETPGFAEARLAPSLADIASVTSSFPRGDVHSVNRRILPVSSADKTCGEPLHWWDHKGTEEWVAYEFPEVTEVRSVEVYWFDDTGLGECRLPESWVVEWRDGDNWREVKGASDYPVALDTFNTVAFSPVKTRALRLRVKLRDGWSAGIQEWRVF